MAEDDDKNVNKPLLEDNVNEQPLIDKKSLKQCDSITECNAVIDVVTDGNDEKAVVLGSEVTEVVTSFVESKVEVEAENVTAGAESVVLSKTNEAVAEEHVSVDQAKIELKKDELVEVMKHEVGSVATGNEENGGAVREGDVSIAEVAKDRTMEQVVREETEPASVLDDSKVLHEAMGAEVETETDADNKLKHEADNSQSVGADPEARVATRNEENGEAVRQGILSTVEATIEVAQDGAMDVKKREEAQCSFEVMDVKGESSNNDAEKLIMNKVEENDEMVVETDVSTIESKAVEMDATKHEEVELVSTLDDSQGALVDEEDEAIDVEEETTNLDTEMETETDTAESGKSLGGKRKRRDSKSPGNSKAAARASSRKITEEDVCFVCFDGGDLVLCDHRGCPKAYHPCCVNRDEAFFRAKGRWNCGNVIRIEGLHHWH